MAHKTAGQTLYQQIRRVSVLGILVAMILATGAGLWLSLAQEQRLRDDTLTAAVQTAAHALALDGSSDTQRLQEYTLRTVEGIEGVDLFAVYDAQGQPVYYADIVSGQAGSAELPALDAELCRRLAQSGEVLLDDAETPLGADHCAVTAVRGANGTVYVESVTADSVPGGGRCSIYGWARPSLAGTRLPIDGGNLMELQDAEVVVGRGGFLVLGGPLQLRALGFHETGGADLNLATLTAGQVRNAWREDRPPFTIPGMYRDNTASDHLGPVFFNGGVINILPYFKPIVSATP